MAETLQSIIDKAIQLANEIGGTKNFYDEATAEILLPNVYKKVILDAQLRVSKPESFRKEVDVVFVNGEGVLPTGFLPEYAHTSILHKRTDATLRAVYRRTFDDFRRAKTSKFSSFTISEGIISFLQAGGEFDTYDGTLQFVTCLIPQMPATATETLDLPDHMVLDIVAELARALRGENVVGEDPPQPQQQGDATQTHNRF